MSDWLHQALLRSEYREEVLLSRHDCGDDEEICRSILKSGLIHQAMPARQVWCPSCNDHLAYATVSAPCEGSILYLRCPGCGIMTTTEAALRRWRFCFEQVLSILRDQLVLTGHPHELVSQRIWQLGRRSLRGNSVSYLLGRGLFRRDAARTLAAIRAPTRAVWLVPAKIPSREVLDLLGGPPVPLTDVLSWRDHAVHCDTSALEPVIPIPPLTRVAPPRKRAPRAAAIEALERQLKDHLRAARDHAQFLLDQNREPVLLPRPSQKDLAKLTGLKAVSVSRCLHDPAANELRLLWEIADDLGQVLRLPAALLR